MMSTLSEKQPLSTAHCSSRESRSAWQKS